MFSLHYLLPHTFVKLSGAKREIFLPEIIPIGFKFIRCSHSLSAYQKSLKLFRNFGFDQFEGFLFRFRKILINDNWQLFIHGNKI